MTSRFDADGPTDAQVAGYLAEVQAHIDRVGWAVQGVFDPADPSGGFSYTVGLTRQPPGVELWLATIVGEQGAMILNAVALALCKGDVPPPVHNAFFSLPTFGTLRFVWRGPVDNDLAAPNTARTLLGVEPVVWQIVWPDDTGLFPGDAGYAEDVFPQRLLGVASLTGVVGRG